MSPTRPTCAPGNPPNSPVSPVVPALRPKRLGSEPENKTSKPCESIMQIAATDTPSATVPPAEPPLDPTREAVRTMRRIRKCFSDHDGTHPFYLEVPLTFKGLEKMREIHSFARCFRRCKTRYFAQKQVFVVMARPGALHSYFVLLLEEEIERQMHQLRENAKHVISRFVKETVRHTDLEVQLPPFESRRSELHLDLCYRHDNLLRPRVVIQVATTQPEESLRDVAEAAIIESKGDIVLVVGLKISYPNSKRATMSIWRADWSALAEQKLVVSVKPTVVCQEFLRDDGSPNPSCEGIQFNLPDLVGKYVFARFKLIHVSAIDLGEYVKESRFRDDLRNKEHADRNAQLGMGWQDAEEPSSPQPQRKAKVRKEGLRVRFADELDKSDIEEA